MVQFVVAFDCDHCGERFDTLNDAVLHERTHEMTVHIEAATMTEPIDTEHEQVHCFFLSTVLEPFFCRTL